MAYPRDEHTTYLSRSSTHALAQGLGWFSIALGLAEALATRRVAAFLGMEGRAELVFAYGVREIGAGVGILTQDDPTPWIWGRVAGDVLDLATLAVAMHPENPQRANVAGAIAAVAGVTVLDVLCGQQLSVQRSLPRRPPPDYSDRVGMPRPPEEMRGAARKPLHAEGAQASATHGVSGPG
jgi:hypothetical protein